MANKKLNAVITIGGAITGGLRSAIGATRDGFQKIGAEIDRVKARQRELTRITEAHTRAGRAGSAMAASYAQQELAQLDKKLARLKKIQSLESARQANAARRSELGGATMGAAVGAAIAAAPVVGATRAAAGWQYEMQLVGNTANMTREQVLALGDEIMRVSKDTGQSAEDTRRAMGFLIAAGMPLETARATLANVGKTATATGGDIEDISKAAFVLVDTLKVKPGRDLQLALDTLAQAGKEGNVELRDMAKVLPVLGSGFTALKMGGREAAATMGAALEIARKGAGDADEAANNVKNYIAKVMSPETLKKAKQNFNLDLYKVIQDAQTSGKNPFEESMKAIMAATKGDQKAIGELFQDMQVQNFIRPMIQNWDEYNRIKNKALAADGVIERDFALMSLTTQQQMKEASNSVGRLSIIIGSALLPALNSVLNVITPVVERIAAFARENPKLVTGLIGVVGGLAALRVGLFAGMWAWTSIKGAAMAFWSVGARLAPLLLRLGSVLLPMVGKAVLFIARALLMNPIGLAVTAIAGGALLIYKNWEPIKAFFGNLWAEVTASTERAMNFIIQKIQWVGQAWAKTKNFFGFGEDGPQPSSVAGATPVPPALPAGAPSMSGGSSSTQQNTFHIVQQPGQDSKALADEVAKRLKQKQEVERRSMNYDAMGNAW